jgi:hypothetical protein
MHGGQTRRALALIQHSLALQQGQQPACHVNQQPVSQDEGASTLPVIQIPEPAPQTEPPRSAGLLIAQALRHSPSDDHPLPCPSDDDPRWLACKARAVRRIALKSGAALPFTSNNPRHGKRPGPGAFVALLLALALYHQEHQAQQRFHVFMVQWAIAALLGVSADTIQRWQQLPEVQRWVHSWRYLDPEAQFKRAGMLYTVLHNPDHRHKKAHTAELLRLPLRSLRMAAANGTTKQHLSDTERPHTNLTLRDIWKFIIPLNSKALSHFVFSSSESVNYVTARSQTLSKGERMAWAEALAAALERHLGLGRETAIRRKFYWKIALTCLRASIRGSLAPLLQLKTALEQCLEAHRQGRVRNLGSFFSYLLREAGFFDLAAFYRPQQIPQINQSRSTLCV